MRTSYLLGAVSDPFPVFSHLIPLEPYDVSIIIICLLRGGNWREEKLSNMVTHATAEMEFQPRGTHYMTCM